MMSRLLSIILVAVLLLLLIVGLVKFNDLPYETPAPSTEGDQTLLPNETDDEFYDRYDFGGEEIGIIMSGFRDATRCITLPEGEDDTHSVNVAVANRNKMVEELLDVKIVPYGTVSADRMVDHMREYFSAPDTKYDIVGLYQYYDLGLAYSDESAFIDIGNYSSKGVSLDPDVDYWDYTSYELLSYGGASYLITGDLSQSWVKSMYVSYVNADILNKYKDQIKTLTGYDDIYELVYSGNWTVELWCQLNEIVHVNSDGDESLTTAADQHGFLGYSAPESSINNFIVDGFLAGCHVTFSKLGYRGVPEIDYNNKVLKAYSDAMVSLYGDSRSCFVDYESDKNSVQYFSEGKTLVTIGTIGDAEKLADMTAGYYILPPPKANSEQRDYYTMTGDSSNFFGIPKKSENSDAAVLTLKALGYYSKKIVTPEIYDIALKGRYTRGDAEAEKASAMIDYIRSKIYSDFLVLFKQSTSGSPVFYHREKVGNSIITSEAVVMRQTWKNELDKILEELEPKAKP